MHRILLNLFKRYLSCFSNFILPDCPCKHARCFRIGYVSTQELPKWAKSLIWKYRCSHNKEFMRVSNETRLRVRSSKQNCQFSLRPTWDSALSRQYLKADGFKMKICASARTWTNAPCFPAWRFNHLSNGTVNDMLSNFYTIFCTPLSINTCDNTSMKLSIYRILLNNYYRTYVVKTKQWI